MTFQLFDKLPAPIQKTGEFQVVYTPSDLVEKILSVFPESVWSDKELKWLVPVSKNGMFELGVYRRLMAGLSAAIPDKDARRKHIVCGMIWSFCPTAGCELVARRNYLGKVWNDMRGFMSNPGNVQVRDFLKARMGQNGAVMVKQDVDNKGEYVKFDCVVGNPPYQKAIENGRSDPANLYPDFVLKAMSLNPDYLSMIIPARCMSGCGKGISKFLKKIIECKKLSKIVYIADSRSCFSGVSIAGGVMYFLMDNSKDDFIVNVNGAEIDLDGAETISTDPISPGIRAKVLAKHNVMFSEKVLGRNPYGITSNFNAWNKSNDDSFVCHCRDKKTNFVSKHHVVRHIETVCKYKMCAPAASAEGISYVFVIPPNHVVSESHLVMGYFDTEKEAINAELFFKTRFTQYIISCIKKTQHLSKRVFKWLPYLDFSRSYTDEDLYVMFGLTAEEIAHIESTTKDFPIFRASRRGVKGAKAKFQEMAAAE